MFGQNFGEATQIGLEAMGCEVLMENGETRQCEKLKDACSAGRLCHCMTRAMEDHPEARAEIVLAAIATMASQAVHLDDVRSALKRFDRVATATC